MSLRVVQFAPTMAPGDGVTNCVFYVDNLLRESGCDTAIFSHRPPFEYRGKVDDIHCYRRGEYDLMLVHHSMGHDLGEWLENVGCARVLVYHNITPAAYFPADSAHHFYARKGREQLAEWAADFSGAIGLSPQNSRELSASDYSNIATIPMLVDLQSITQTGSRPPFEVPDTSRPLILSVGRLVENKQQHMLIEAMDSLRSACSEHEPLLILVGATTNPGYEARLRHSIAELRLENNVIMPGQLSDAALRWLYARADLYWCGSEHEGFCMPLVEASAHDLPVIACNAPGIVDTLGKAGLILENPDAQLLAASTLTLLNHTELEEALITAGRENLQRFERGRVRNQLADYLASLQISGQQTESPASSLSASS